MYFREAVFEPAETRGFPAVAGVALEQLFQAVVPAASVVIFIDVVGWDCPQDLDELAGLGSAGIDFSGVLYVGHSPLLVGKCFDPAYSIACFRGFPPLLVGGVEGLDVRKGEGWGLEGVPADGAEAVLFGVEAEGPACEFGIGAA